VREWVAHFGSLGYCAGQDHVVGLNELGRPNPLGTGDKYHAVADGYLDYRAEGARSSWWLHADTPGELERLARHVRRWGELERTLAAKTEQGRAVLGRLRG
jgi:hypothetical protein